MRFLVTELNNTELANIVAVRLLLDPSGDGDRSCQHNIMISIQLSGGRQDTFTLHYSSISQTDKYRWLIQRGRI